MAALWCDGHYRNSPGRVCGPAPRGKRGGDGGLEGAKSRLVSGCSRSDGNVPARIGEAGSPGEKRFKSPIDTGDACGGRSYCPSTKTSRLTCNRVHQRSVWSSSTGTTPPKQWRASKLSTKLILHQIMSSL